MKTEYDPNTDYILPRPEYQLDEAKYYNNPENGRALIKYNLPNAVNSSKTMRTLNPDNDRDTNMVGLFKEHASYYLTGQILRNSRVTVQVEELEKKRAIINTDADQKVQMTLETAKENHPDDEVPEWLKSFTTLLLSADAVDANFEITKITEENKKNQKDVAYFTGKALGL